MFAWRNAKKPETPSAVFFALPYSQRQLIIVVDKNLFNRSFRKKALFSNLDVAKVVGSFVVIGVFGAVYGYYKEKNAQKVMVIPHRIADAIQFPIGHPVHRFVYAGHPTLSQTYYPIDQFHRFLFEQKFAEAFRLLVSLGAVELGVHHRTGWAREVSASVLPLRTFELRHSAHGDSGMIWMESC